jgi:hypothetical protein
MLDYRPTPFTPKHLRKERLAEFRQLFEAKRKEAQELMEQLPALSSRAAS